MNEFVTFQCPHCWQSIEIAVDLSVREQEYVQDCEVCCNPITIRVRADGRKVLDISAEPAQ